MIGGTLKAVAGKSTVVAKHVEIRNQKVSMVAERTWGLVRLRPAGHLACFSMTWELELDRDKLCSGSKMRTVDRHLRLLSQFPFESGKV